MTDTPEQPQQRPEGAIIQRYQKAKGLSARKAAERAGMSDARWRQIVNGYQSVSKGMKAPVIAPAETLVKMAKVVGAPKNEFREAREDAYRIMLSEFVRDDALRSVGPERAATMTDEDLDKWSLDRDRAVRHEVALKYYNGEDSSEPARQAFLKTLSDDDIIEAASLRMNTLRTLLRDQRKNNDNQTPNTPPPLSPAQEPHAQVPADEDEKITHLPQEVTDDYLRSLAASETVHREGERLRQEQDEDAEKGDW